jgi:hypothetical protein
MLYNIFSNSSMINTGLTLIIAGAFIMFFNMPRGKNVPRRIKMKRWVRLGMSILSLGTIIQIINIFRT